MCVLLLIRQSHQSIHWILQYTVGFNFFSVPSFFPTAAADVLCNLFILPLWLWFQYGIYVECFSFSSFVVYSDSQDICLVHYGKMIIMAANQKRKSADAKPLACFKLFSARKFSMTFINLLFQFFCRSRRRRRCCFYDLSWFIHLPSFLLLFLVCQMWSSWLYCRPLFIHVCVCDVRMIWSL